MRFLLLSLALAAVLLPAPGRAADPASRRFAATGFDAVELVGPDDVRIVPGGGFDVTATGEARALDALDISVRDHRLRIARKSGNYHDHGATITVTMPRLASAKLTGSGDLTAERFDQDRFEGVLTGSGDLRINALRVGQGTFVLTGSGDLDLDAVTATSLDLTVRGSGDLDAAGAARTAKIAMVGSGDIDARRLSVGDADISLAGSGDIHAFATRRASVAANGAGDVTVTGHPRCSVSGANARDVTCG